MTVTDRKEANVNKNTKCRYLIVCFDSEAEKVVADFWAFTQQQADYRLQKQRSLFPRSDLKLFPYSSLTGWVANDGGKVVIRSGVPCIEPSVTSVTADTEMLTGGRIFVDTAAHLSCKYDLTFVLDQAGQKAVAFEGVLWKRGTKARDVLAQVGNEIDRIQQSLI